MMLCDIKENHGSLQIDLTGCCGRYDVIDVVRLFAEKLHVNVFLSSNLAFCGNVCQIMRRTECKYKS